MSEIKGIPLKQYHREYHKKYRLTPKGLKSERIAKWKVRGLIGDYEEIYDVYINTNFCEECHIPLIEGLYGFNRKVLDHNHETGEFRNVLCCGCNTRRG
tara:strand:- start:1704 stop:2000 length:297 start_codon:yes stop_codon:yes gene_type:complete